MLSSQVIQVDGFYFLVSEEGIEDAVGLGWPKGDRLSAAVVVLKVLWGHRG